MTLLTPAALFLSAIAIPIVAMYMLKLRRHRHDVSSTFLWRRLLEDTQADSPWQRLRFNILLLLQLLAVAALILSLAGPAYSQSRGIYGDVIVIVDQSYGMQARDATPSRFAVALARARALASGLGSGKVMSVIGMAAQPSLAIAESGDHGAIERAIDGLRAGIDHPNVLGALSLAVSLARAGQNTRAIVFTSRDSGISTLPLHVPFPVDVVRIGGALHDLGITAFGATQSQLSVQAAARISNFGSTAERSDLELTADGKLADVRSISLAAHAQQNVGWTGLPLGVRSLRLRITRRDDVAADKTAWAVVAAQPVRRVLLVDSGDYFLETALRLQDGVQLSVALPSAYVPGVERAYDLVIFDGVLPPALPPMPVLLVAPPAGRSGPLHFGRNGAAGAATETAAAKFGPLAPLLSLADLSDVHVAQARAVTLPAWMQTLASASGKTLLAAGDSGTARAALVNFNLEHSDWPLRASFPTVILNVLKYLAPGLTSGATQIETGQAVRLFPVHGTRELAVTKPDGAVDTLRPPFPPFTDTSTPGLYTARVPGARPGTVAAQSQSFAVNFFPARPGPAGGPAVLHLGHGGAATTHRVSIPVRVDWSFVLLAAAILGAEWWVAFRGLRL